MDRNEANATIPRINIKGKQYATVDARVAAFWELYPDGEIHTELLEDDGDRCLFKATAINGGRVLATGHAFEVKGASHINKTSYIENCETSAVGRALGFLGIGSNGSIASADEVSNAIEQLRSPAEELAAMWQVCIDQGVDKKGMAEWFGTYYGGKKLGNLTEQERDEVRAYLTEKLEAIND